MADGDQKSEKLVWKSQPDQFGNDHNLLVGERSGKVYEDSHDNQLRYLNTYDEKINGKQFRIMN